MYVKDGGTIEGISYSNIHIDTSVDHYNRTTNSSRTWVEYPIFIDLERRTPESGLSRIRDVSFSDIQIQTKGRVLVAGMPERALENFSFRNIAMRITGFEPVEQQHKPRGVHGMPNAPREIDYASAPAAMIFANIHGLDLRDVHVTWDANSEPQDRHAIYAARIDDFFLTGFSGSPSGSKLAALGLDGVRHATISESRTSDRTASFIGLHDTEEVDVVLTGNRLGKNARAMTTGAAYVHINRDGDKVKPTY